MVAFAIATCNHKVAYMMTTDLSRIERSVHIRAPRERVWRALTRIEEFSKCFGVSAAGRFEPGARLKMTLTMEGQGHGDVFDIVVDTMRPIEYFSWRWHPGMVRPEVDYSREPMTLVEFTLTESDGGTRVTVVETGFDQISLTRRAKVFEENVGGWEYQVKALREYVDNADRG